MAGLPELYDNKMNYRQGAGAVEAFNHSGFNQSIQGYINNSNQPANKVAILYIDSRHKNYVGDTADDFSVDLQINLPNVKAIQLLQAYVPVTFNPFQNGIMRWRIVDPGNVLPKTAVDADVPEVDRDNAIIFLPCRDEVYLGTGESGFKLLARDMAEATKYYLDLGATENTTYTEIHYYIELASNGKVKFYCQLNAVGPAPNAAKFYIEWLPEIPANSGYTYIVDPKYVTSSYPGTGIDLTPDEKKLTLSVIPEINFIPSHNFGFQYRVGSGEIIDVANSKPYYLQDDSSNATSLKYNKHIISDYVGTIQNEAYVNIYVNVDLNSFHTSRLTDRKNVLCQVPLSNYGTTVQINKLNTSPMPVDINSLKSLSFSIEFADGTKAKFEPNQHLSFQIKAWYYEPQKGNVTAHH
jgi:hypothetical protein